VKKGGPVEVVGHTISSACPIPLVASIKIACALMPLIAHRWPVWLSRTSFEAGWSNLWTRGAVSWLFGGVADLAVPVAIERGQTFHVGLTFALWGQAMPSSVIPPRTRAYLTRALDIA
jgi:hypothetical protein